MRMELIQPFINAADAVLSETLACPVTVSDISMEKEAYQRRGSAALVEITGDIEGRVIFDIEDGLAMKVARFAGNTDREDAEILLRRLRRQLAFLRRSTSRHGFSLRRRADRIPEARRSQTARHRFLTRPDAKDLCAGPHARTRCGIVEMDSERWLFLRLR